MCVNVAFVVDLSRDAVVRLDTRKRTHCHILREVGTQTHRFTLLGHRGTSGFPKAQNIRILKYTFYTRDNHAIILAVCIMPLSSGCQYNLHGQVSISELSYVFVFLNFFSVH